MVCAADAVGSASTGSSDLDIGCLIDLATGLVSFTANGKELPTTYQVELTTQSPDLTITNTTRPGVSVRLTLKYSLGKHNDVGYRFR